MGKLEMCLSFQRHKLLTSLLCYPCKEVRLDPQAGVRACVSGGAFTSVWGFFAVGGHGSLQTSSEPV